MIPQQEPISKEFIKQFLPPEPVIIEAGAHKGRDTLKMLKVWPQARIYAFEPVPELFELLVTKTHETTQVSCYQLALAAHTGTALYNVSSGASDAASSLLTPTGYIRANPQVHFSQQIQVATSTLDDWAQKHNVPALDFMWLDMQGSELAMLKASPRIVSTVKVIYTEIALEERYAGAPLFNEYRAWLEAQGFRLITYELRRIIWGNALFVRTGWLNPEDNI